MRLRLPGRLRRSGARRGLTGRALVLGAVLILLAVVLAPPMHRYLAARGSVQQAEHQRRDDQKQLAELKAQLKQWDDPAYIEAQARSRLQYAMPGETVYVVVRPGDKTGVSAPPQRDRDAVQVPGGTWNERLWGSVLTADAVP
ncbi:MAG TPA: septum formation initiator family protein [Jatrophihabitantaceae bacterium]|jgi:cell division protein FtsB